MALSYGEVAEIIRIIDASNCEELILELEGARLVVRRGGASAGGEAARAPTVQSTTGTGSAAPSAADSAAARPARKSESSPTTAAPAGTTTVCSPMVGTFYRRPSPDEAPFIEQGASVRAGDALGLIEVMKLYTTIESPVDGVVEAILAEDGALAEFDQPLFVIRPR